MSSARATLGSWVMAVGVSLHVAMAAVGAPTAPNAPTFERDIRPILKAQCFQCHGESGKTKGGIDLRLRRLMLHGDDGPAIVPGKASESRLLQLVRSGEMPKDGKPLSPAQVQLIERWISLGAPTARPEPETAPDFVITAEDRKSTRLSSSHSSVSRMPSSA
mgnify:CR=1 FL=1